MSNPIPSILQGSHSIAPTATETELSVPPGGPSIPPGGPNRNQSSGQLMAEGAHKMAYGKPLERIPNPQASRIPASCRVIKRLWGSFVACLFGRKDTVRILQAQAESLFRSQQIQAQNKKGSTSFARISADATYFNRQLKQAIDATDDGLLAGNLKVGKPKISGNTDPLFTHEPILADIQQGDMRQDCYFLAALQGVLASPSGAQKIQEIMRENADSSVTVAFRDRLVTVTKAQISGGSRPVYSKGATWVRVLEKAFQAYQQEEGKKFDGQGQSVGLAAFHHILPTPPEGRDGSYFSGKFTSRKTALNHFDGDSLVEAFRNPSGLENCPPNTESIITTAWDQGAYGAVIRAALDAGTPVLVGSHPVFGIGHSQTIVGKAVDKIGHNGFLVRDPYGRSIGEDSIGSSSDTSKDSSFNRGRTCVYFVREDELGKYFSDISFGAWVGGPPESLLEQALE